MEFNIIHQPEKMEVIVSLTTISCTDIIFFLDNWTTLQSRFGKMFEEEYSMQKEKRVSILQTNDLHYMEKVSVNIYWNTCIYVCVCNYTCIHRLIFPIFAFQKFQFYLSMQTGQVLIKNIIKLQENIY